MKKNKVKKLTLAKETLHILNDLGIVRGAAGTEDLSQCQSCAPYVCPLEIAADPNS